MVYLHLLMAVLASWRITELFTQDRITDRLRKRFPTYLWQCPRCMSVWASAWVSLIFALGLRWPMLMWLNWPFALAWLYLVQLDYAVTRRVSQKGREIKISLMPNNQWQLYSDIGSSETASVLGTVLGNISSGSQTNGVAYPPTT